MALYAPDRVGNALSVHALGRASGQLVTGVCAPVVHTRFQAQA